MVGTVVLALLALAAILNPTKVDLFLGIGMVVFGFIVVFGIVSISILLIGRLKLRHSASNRAAAPEVGIRIHAIAAK
jgi:hypothetical protein